MATAHAYHFLHLLFFFFFWRRDIAFFWSLFFFFSLGSGGKIPIICSAWCMTAATVYRKRSDFVFFAFTAHASCVWSSRFGLLGDLGSICVGCQLLRCCFLFEISSFLNHWVASGAEWLCDLGSRRRKRYMSALLGCVILF